MRLDIPHDVIHVNVITARGHVLRVLFLELVRFRFFAHAADACRGYLCRGYICEM